MEKHTVDYEKDMAHDAGNHMPWGGQNENPSDPIGVGHQIHGVGDRPAGQSHQMMA